MLLDRWVQARFANPNTGNLDDGDCLVGEVYDYKKLPNGTRVKTGAIRFVDPINFKAETLNDDGSGTTEKWDLGVPGKIEYYENPAPKRLEKDPQSGIIYLNDSVFLNPKG